MTGAGDDTGEVETISEKDLVRLLDRSELQPGDEAYCADELLGEVILLHCPAVIDMKHEP
jgi:hypothetical protein